MNKNQQKKRQQRINATNRRSTNSNANEAKQEFIPKIGIVGETDIITVHAEITGKSFVNQKNAEKIRDSIGETLDYNNLDELKKEQKNLTAFQLMIADYVEQMFPMTYNTAKMFKQNVAIAIYRQHNGQYCAVSLGTCGDANTNIDDLVHQTSLAFVNSARFGNIKKYEDKFDPTSSYFVTKKMALATV